ncbi:hypothetical protein ROZALSC1DRAFT_30686 [Rozella allomycis CSF55]|uniref:Uncharacterized protein n=1 Tax=Rozella allomycis (strain CSF55) TaxID=988480 RepID=A0A075B2Z5_ROZAC|nr:hypothetical protein O9G_003637 [Rozella allomycis CSF55]RKP17511.1 hypothetical protein ROZALSC1DRAFT_30686 [Rozella allomycis CSF55]|eukprot:EPZ35148.1 hypothetical protein O9G_003637 [Rozella allomycis CSF55]
MNQIHQDVMSKTRDLVQNFNFPTQTGDADCEYCYERVYIKQGKDEITKTVVQHKKITRAIDGASRIEEIVTPEGESSGSKSIQASNKDQPVPMPISSPKPKSTKSRLSLPPGSPSYKHVAAKVDSGLNKKSSSQNISSKHNRKPSSSAISVNSSVSNVGSPSFSQKKSVASKVDSGLKRKPSVRNFASSISAAKSHSSNTPAKSDRSNIASSHKKSTQEKDISIQASIVSAPKSNIKTGSHLSSPSMIKSEYSSNMGSSLINKQASLVPSRGESLSLVDSAIVKTPSARTNHVRSRASSSRQTEIPPAGSSREFSCEIPPASSSNAHKPIEKKYTQTIPTIYEQSAHNEQVSTSLIHQLYVAVNQNDINRVANIIQELPLEHEVLVIFEAVCSQGKTDIAFLLMEQYSYLKLTSARGKVLMTAVANNNYAVTKFLLDNSNMVFHDDTAHAAKLALQMKNAPIVEILIIDIFIHSKLDPESIDISLINDCIKFVLDHQMYDLLGLLIQQQKYSNKIKNYVFNYAVENDNPDIIHFVTVDTNMIKKLTLYGCHNVLARLFKMPNQRPLMFSITKNSYLKWLKEGRIMGLNDQISFLNLKNFLNDKFSFIKCLKRKFASKINK